MTPRKTTLLFLFLSLLAFSDEGEEDGIASYQLSAPAYRCSPIQGSEFPRFECFEEKKPRRFTLMAPVVNKASWDLHMSPYAGGEDLLFATRVLEKLETYMLSKSPIAYAKSAYARFWRLSELISIWLP